MVVPPRATDIPERNRIFFPESFLRENRLDFDHFRVCGYTAIKLPKGKKKTRASLPGGGYCHIWLYRYVPL